jgi:protein required for attachment to host cells
MVLKSFQLMKSKLLIVADLGLVKAYQLDFTLNRTPRLEQLEEVVLEEAHGRMLDKVTDAAGRNSSPTQKNRGAPLADDHNFKLEFKRRLIHQIAEHIQRLIERSDSEICWLAAHKEINQKILERLPAAVCKRIKKNLLRDLTKVGQKELLEQFLNADAFVI